ncbi:MAG: DUF3078 domain-containing protein [Bacteroidales bacterium]|nr:DUF3078 domain-containing protein [Bacteroidales bacterium]
MKRFLNLTLLIITFSVQGVFSQDSLNAKEPLKDTAWKCGGTVAFTLSQSHYANWAAGGENMHSFNGRAQLFLNYSEKKVSWENTLDLAYGLTYTESTDYRKNDDLFELNSKFGYQASNTWNYSAVFNMKSQFDAGKDYSDPDTIIEISNFIAPLYLNFAIGMDYKPYKSLSAFISPANLKLTYVNNVDLAERYSLKKGEQSKIELGAIIKIKFQQDITKDFNLQSKLDVFYSYTDITNIPHISWEILATLKLFKAISVNLNTHLIYDEKYKNPKDEEPRVQFKEIFGIGITYKW